MKGTKEWRVWQGIKNRCYNPRVKPFKNYGGRGITVCEKWRNSFETFVADVGKAPSGLTLEGIDNNGHYEPGNCKWATPLEQAHNRRTNRLLTAFGKTQIASEWAKEMQISKSRLSAMMQSEFSLEAELLKRGIYG
jgi:hypothetical protein